MSREGHCEFEGCEKKIKAKRLCQYHYYKYLYPEHRDRPNVVLKKDLKYGVAPKFSGVSGEELWNLISKDIAAGNLSLNALIGK